MILPIIKYGSPILREKAFAVDPGDYYIAMAQNILQSLKNAGGIGLAGPQVGLLKNIFIIDTTPMKEEGIIPIEKVIFNPEIVHYGDDEVYYKEGCLSIPGINEDVSRAKKIEVRYRNENFEVREEVLDGLVARIFQHEYDHLQGILFIDKLSSIRKKLIRSKLREIIKTQKYHYTSK
ncbi:MAG: peptide deformylase [Bacteroidales bacterium]|nr:peptide deformylase [Bacteroidales bacterium]